VDETLERVLKTHKKISHILQRWLRNIIKLHALSSRNTHSIITHLPRRLFDPLTFDLKNFPKKAIHAAQSAKLFQYQFYWIMKMLKSCKYVKFVAAADKSDSSSTSNDDDEENDHTKSKIDIKTAYKLNLIQLQLCFRIPKASFPNYDQLVTLSQKSSSTSKHPVQLRKKKKKHREEVENETKQTKQTKQSEQLHQYQDIEHMRRIQKTSEICNELFTLDQQQILRNVNGRWFTDIMTIIRIVNNEETFELIKTYIQRLLLMMIWLSCFNLVNQKVEERVEDQQSQKGKSIVRIHKLLCQEAILKRQFSETLVNDSIIFIPISVYVNANVGKRVNITINLPFLINTNLPPTTTTSTNNLAVSQEYILPVLESRETYAHYDFEPEQMYLTSAFRANDEIIEMFKQTNNKFIHIRVKSMYGTEEIIKKFETVINEARATSCYRWYSHLSRFLRVPTQSGQSLDNDDHCTYDKKVEKPNSDEDNDEDNDNDDVKDDSNEDKSPNLLKNQISDISTSLATLRSSVPSITNKINVLTEHLTRLHTESETFTRCSLDYTKTVKCLLERSKEFRSSQSEGIPISNESKIDDEIKVNSTLSKSMIKDITIHQFTDRLVPICSKWNQTNKESYVRQLYTHMILIVGSLREILKCIESKPPTRRYSVVSPTIIGEPYFYNLSKLDKQCFHKTTTPIITSHIDDDDNVDINVDIKDNVNENDDNDNDNDNDKSTKAISDHYVAEFYKLMSIQRAKLAHELIMDDPFTKYAQVEIHYDINSMVSSDNELRTELKIEIPIMINIMKNHRAMFGNRSLLTSKYFDKLHSVLFTLPAVLIPLILDYLNIQIIDPIDHVKMSINYL
jgi:hypothetical protein